jgi:phosphoserine phosphatase
MNPYAILIAIAIFAGSNTIAFFQGRSSKARDIAVATAKAVQVAVAQERQAQIEVNNAQAETVKLIKSNDARLLAISDGLRQRAERRAANTAAPAQCNGATGKELSRPDGEFLARYAADAEAEAIKLRELQGYVQKYCKVPAR